jgi:ABC-type multidrug transport system fused ATPase/permease subunit
MAKEKKYKESLKYGIFSNMVYSFVSVWQEDKPLILLVLLGTAMRVAVPFAGIVTPKIVIDEITGGAAPIRFLSVMGVMAAILITIHFIRGFTDAAINQNIKVVRGNIFAKQCAEKMLSMDYETQETGPYARCLGRGWMLGNNYHCSDNYIMVCSALAVNVAGFLLYSSMVALIHPLILVLIGAGALVNWLMLSWYLQYSRDRWDKYELWRTQQMLGYAGGVYGDKGNAKDLRLYEMLPWFNKRFDFYLNLMRQSDAKLSFRNLLGHLANGFMVIVRDGFAYAFLVYLLLNGRIGLGDFVMIFAAIGGVGGWLSNAIGEIHNLRSSATELSYRRELLDYPSVSEGGTGKPLPPPDKPPEIVLENVSYTYPKYDLQAEGRLILLESEPTLENINMVIKPGERIALVGINGAGKTTLIKIICGLYTPTSGRVLLNGNDIREYNQYDYFKYITAVFQDIYILAESIIENVSQQTEEKTDRKRALACLEKAGLADKLSNLHDGADTKLVREVHETATDLSGGEIQKLALARALYKDAPVIILDEPTAALDPIAENGVYQQYAEMTKGKTSIYISHRLASTRFCDRILLMDNKTITEEGPHDALMKRGGKYAEMYSVQSSYYVDKGEAQNA